MDSLNTIITDNEGEHRVVSVCVIAGTAGAGKTSLALRWAHQVHDRFPDGQLYVNLRGYDPGEPVTAQVALHRFLAALGVPASAIPPDTEAAAALYRSLLADRRMLVLLDNAATTAQVRPLLPGSSGCLAVVTSRSRLSGLAVRDGAHRLTLGTLPETEAVALLRAITAGYRPDDDTDKLAELVRLCARLPLALRVAAERAASRPHMRLDDLIADLRDESALWEALSTGDEGDMDGVRSVFAWSYRALPPEAGRLFRLLGLHPGLDIGVEAASALAHTSTRHARQLLDALADAHVLEQSAPDRYEFHDLLRAYAIDQAQNEESAEDRTAALRRLLDWYLHTADAAQSWIEPAEEHVSLDPPDDGVAPLTFADYDQAVDWSEREHPNFLPLVRAAETAGLDQHTWRLAAVLFNAQAPTAVATDWLAIGKIGLDAARRLGDRSAQAFLLDGHGFSFTTINRLADGEDCHRQAFEIQRELGDRYGEAASHNALGLIRVRRRQLNEAEEHFTQAITVFDELGETHWRAVSQANLAETYYQAGRLSEAATVLDQALVAHRDRKDRRSEGNALRIRSAIHLDRGEPDNALRAANDALEIAADLRDHVAEGYWLLNLGNAQRALGRFADALVSYQRSATLYRRLMNRVREARAWQGAGETYHLLERDSEAADFHRRAADAFKELGDAWHEAAARDSLAATLVEESPDEARQHWSEAQRLLADYDDPRARNTRERIGRGLADVS